MSDNDKAAKKAEAQAKKEAMQLAYFYKMQELEAAKEAAKEAAALARDKANMNSVDGGGKAKKMRRSRRKSLRKTRQRNRKRHGRKSRRRL
jgi:hypothetical protein